MKNLKSITTILVLALLTFTSCRRTLTHVSPNEEIYLSGRWNDSDSKKVAEAMIQDVLNRPWREDFAKGEGRKPVVIIGMVQNKTTEHIESETFIKDMERNFINSGMVRVVENNLFREKLREERAEQGEFASPETQARWGKELGADFMMFGIMTSTTDSYKKDKLVNYKVNLELVNIETNEKVWIGDKEIKRLIQN